MSDALANRSSEHHIALREAHSIASADAYFGPRPVEDGAMQRKAFQQGFTRGFDAAVLLCEASPQNIAPDRVYVAPASPLQEPADEKAVFKRDRLEEIIDDYIEGYEFRGDEGDYTPTEREQFLVKDAIMGLLVDPEWDAEWGRWVKELAARAALSTPVRQETAEAKALEFAEYMAKGAEQLIDKLNAEDALRLRREESDDVEDDAVYDAACTRGEFVTGLRSSIYEFRKRAAKVGAA